MELDALKQTWDSYDRRLDALTRLNLSQVRDTSLGKTQTALKRLSRLLWLELILTAAVALVTGSFLWDHLATLRFLLPGAALHAAVIALIIVLVRQITVIARIDYGQPVVAIQKRLESLHVERIRATRWTFLLAPLAWTPLLIVGMKGLLGVDVYAAFPAAWLVGNVLFGLIVLGLGLWISKRYADRLRHTSWMRSILRDIAGQNLNAARGFLRSLAEFETEA